MRGVCGLFNCFSFPQLFDLNKESTSFYNSLSKKTNFLILKSLKQIQQETER